MRVIESHLKYGRNKSENRVVCNEIIIILEPLKGGYTDMDACAYMLEKSYGSWQHSVSGKDYAELYSSQRESIIFDNEQDMKAAIEEFVLNIREILIEPINIKVFLENIGE